MPSSKDHTVMAVVNSAAVLTGMGYIRQTHSPASYERGKRIMQPNHLWLN